MKKTFCILLAAALALCLAAFPAAAEEAAAPPEVDFAVEVYDRLTMGDTHLFASITPSVEGPLFTRADIFHNGVSIGGNADAWHAYGTDTERYIMSRLEEPYAGYLTDKTAFTLQFAIYYKLTEDGEEYGPVIREFTCSYPTEYTALDLTEHTVYGLYGSTVTERMGWRRNIKYSITATRGSAPEEILFPQTIPVEVQVHKGIDVAFMGTCPYGVRWQAQAATADENIAVYPLDTLFLPAQTTDFVIRNRLHRFSTAEDGISVLYPSVTEVMQSGPSANLYVSFVEEGYLPTVALAWNNSALEAIFDYKPTGALALEVYTAADGENWTLANRIDCSDGLPGDIYKNTGYSTAILSQQQTDTLLAASHEDPARQGFFVKLRVIGGPLGNREMAPDGTFTYTDTAPLKWPENYEFEPGGSGDTTGSGGNQGNTGADNDGTGGQRPGTEGGDNNSSSNSGSSAESGSSSASSSAPDSSSSAGSSTPAAPHLHSWSQRLADDENHFYQCTTCGAFDEVTPHTLDADGSCVVCGHTPSQSEEASSAPESVSSPADSSAPAQSSSAASSASGSSAAAQSGSAGGADSSGSTAVTPDTSDFAVYSLACLAAAAVTACLAAVILVQRRFRQDA